ncbi:bifunctional nuclease family protein [Lyngbya confervoides]|uniref:Bifunctional nuclease family protein n=1 Tax=Lyngbya confervoides BDU141951 TaxID=1574623 RepID=A0ABD4T9R1_9CYAN|nr:bifunctional nuclease family protein [Lyngbya confervoides]MCM1985229.1 bifunctional nuclease family protein [Lyngbya confervoides BDU141951]
MIEMNVAGIALDASSRIPIVLLKDATERRALPIWIGQNEAKAILSALEDQKPPRPMTHDLLCAMLQEWEIEFDRVVINALEDSTFFATISLKQGETIKYIDARPSDAIALALRLDAPIWVMEEVVADASIPVDQEADEAEREEFKRFIDQIRPGDFKTQLDDSEATKG